MKDDQQLAQDSARSADPTVNLTAGEQRDATTSGAPGVPDSKDPLIGTIFLDRYEMVEIVGRGGMSVVYKAKHLMLERFFAIKLLHPHLATDENALRRFKQEAKSASQLKYDGIIGITDFGVTERGQPYLVMEFVDGASLGELLNRETFEPARALNLVSQICAALAHAHKAGIVHRDIKPSNVLVLGSGTDEERIKVCDFGIAKMLEDDGSRQSLTQTGESIGSPPYMSPEQCQGGPLDARSDIYSTGCLLYELIAGEPPFRGGSIFETIHMQITAMPPSVRKSRPNIVEPTIIDGLILKALEKERAHRYQTIDEFSQAIAKVSTALGAKKTFAQRIHSHLPIIASRLRSRNARVAGMIIVAVLAPCVVSAFLLAQKSTPVLTPIQGNSISSELVSNPDKENFSRLLDEGTAMLEGGQPGSAIGTLQQAEQVGLRALGQRDVRYQQCLATLAKAAEAAGNFQLRDTTTADLERIRGYAPDVRSINANADLISETNSKLSNDPKNKTLIGELGRHYYHQAILYLQDNDYSRVLLLGEQALRLNELAHGANSKEVAEILVVMTAAYTERLLFPAAEKCIERVINIATSLEPKIGQTLVADAHYRRGRIYWHKAHAADQQAKSGYESTKIVAAKNELEKEAKAAAQSFKTAEAIYGSQPNGERSPRYADACIQLGASEALLKDWKSSREHLGKGVTIVQAYYGPEHTKLGKAYWYLAEAMHRSATAGTTITPTSLQEADSYFARAQSIFEKNSRDLEHSSLVAVCLLERAAIQRELGALPQAETLYRGAYKLSRDAGKRSATYARAGNALAAVLHAQGKDQESAAIMREMQAKSSTPVQLPKAAGNLNEPISDDDQ